MYLQLKQYIQITNSKVNQEQFIILEGNFNLLVARQTLKLQVYKKQMQMLGIYKPLQRPLEAELQTRPLLCPSMNCNNLAQDHLLPRLLQVLKEKYFELVKRIK